MNRREKKKLKVKYIKRIKSLIEIIKSKYEDCDELINNLKTLKGIVESVDHKKFYEMNQAYLWPNLRREARIEAEINNFKNNPKFTREFSLYLLDIILDDKL